MKFKIKTLTSAIGALSLGAALSSPIMASSHREAPFLTNMPKVDATDFYMFRSYETGREDYVTIVANYQPLQDAYGGPNYFDLKDDALYEIHIDNNGDAEEDLTFSFKFETEVQDLALNIEGFSVSVPLKNIGQIGPNANDTGALNVKQRYSITHIEGDRRRGSKQPLLNSVDSSQLFARPADNIGTKSIPDYEAYARTHIHSVALPGCDNMAKVFVGQRKDPFVVNLGEIFDLVNLNPLSAPDARPNTIDDKNVTAIIMELPISCVTNGSEPVIGAWTTASIRQAQIINPAPNFDNAKAPAIVGGPWAQVSRLGMPLVNEVVIGLKDKDRFNASEPKDDSQFATYVTHPAMPELLEILFPGTAVAPNLFPRTDLVAAFLTGVSGLNQPVSVVGSEMLRLNTGIAPTAAGEQNNLGVLGGDLAGFPNGRRPGDDVVDSVLRVAMGALIEDESVAPNRAAPLTDGATVSASDFSAEFPYLISPIAGAGE